MNSKEMQLKMENEVQKRIDSREWSSRIASRVVSARNRNKKINIFAVSLSSLATAAVIILALFINSDTRSANIYEEFIQSQLEGTYSEVFNESYSQNNSNTSDDILQYDNIDYLIDTALSSR